MDWIFWILSELKPALCSNRHCSHAAADYHMALGLPADSLVHTSWFRTCWRDWRGCSTLTQLFRVRTVVLAQLKQINHQAIWSFNHHSNCVAFCVQGLHIREVKRGFSGPGCGNVKTFPFCPAAIFWKKGSSLKKHQTSPSKCQIGRKTRAFTWNDMSLQVICLKTWGWGSVPRGGMMASGLFLIHAIKELSDTVPTLPTALTTACDEHPSAVQ